MFLWWTIANNNANASSSFQSILKLIQGIYCLFSFKKKSTEDIFFFRVNDIGLGLA